MKKNKWTVLNWKKDSFKNKLDYYFKSCNSFVSTIINDLKYIYEIRNLIVHEWKTINPKDSWFVDFSIRCVFYFYKFTSQTQDGANFFLQLEMHYISIKDLIFWWDLSNFIKNKDDKIREINSPKDLDDVFAEMFKISSDKISDIKNNLLNSYF